MPWREWCKDKPAWFPGGGGVVLSFFTAAIAPQEPPPVCGEGPQADQTPSVQMPPDNPRRGDEQEAEGGFSHRGGGAVAGQGLGFIKRVLGHRGRRVSAPKAEGEDPTSPLSEFLMVIAGCNPRPHILWGLGLLLRSLLQPSTQLLRPDFRRTFGAPHSAQASRRRAFCQVSRISVSRLAKMLSMLPLTCTSARPTTS